MPLCLGARIIITRNIATQHGIVNGSMGTLVDMIWLEGESPIT